jgi:hypothetical protein
MNPVILIAMHHHLNALEFDYFHIFHFMRYTKCSLLGRCAVHSGK